MSSINPAKPLSLLATVCITMVALSEPAIATGTQSDTKSEVAQTSSHADDCYQYVKDHPEYYVVVLDASLHPPRFSSLSQKTYASVDLRVCIHKPDYSRRYEVQVNYADLKSPPSILSIADLVVQRSGGDANRDFSEELKAAGKVITDCNAYLNRESKNIFEQLQKLVAQEGRAVTFDDAQKIHANLEKSWNLVKNICPGPQLDAALKKLQLAMDQNGATKEVKKFCQHKIDIKKTLEPRINAWDKAIQFSKKHISTVDENVFTLGSRVNTEAEVVVRSAPLVMTSITGNAGNTDEKTDGKVDDDADEKTTASLSYGPVTDLAGYTFQIRSLSYVRFGFSLGYSSVQNQGVTTGRNDTGSEVLRTKQDMGLTSMILMTHYWCGADEREIQPWDRSRGCWWANLLPTIAVGLPITAINTFQHIFLGAVWQPVPAIGLVGGAHLGRVDRMRAEFSDGMAFPAGNTGFRPEVDTVETVTKIGWYVGAVVTDAAFIKLFKDIALPKK